MLNHALFRILPACLLLALPLSRAFAQKDDRGREITETALVADTVAFEAGRPFHVGVHMKMAPKWHTYWQFGGAPFWPFGIDWELPEGWQVGSIGFPLPLLVVDQDGQTLFGYEHEVLFVVKITPSAKPAQGGVHIGAKAKWQVCAEKCIIGDASLELNLPAGEAKPANAELFAKWMAQLPREDAPPTKDVSYEAKDKTLIVRVGGLPKDETAEFFPLPPEDFSSTLELGKKVTNETAADGTRVFGFPFEDKVPPNLAWSGLLVVQKPGGLREGWMLRKTASASAPSPKPELAPTAGAGTVPETAGWDPFDDIQKGEKGAKSGGLLFLLIQGFLGGLLLNLMPCVLPVISLKIFGFVQQAGEARERIFKLGLAFCAGVFAFFAIIATLIVALASFGKTFGWGAQFSNPVLLTVMIGVVFVFGLSLLGVFEITLGGGTTSKLSELSSKEGVSGAFVHGLFTTLLGTSCTAPLVGPVIGAAITRPGPQVFAMFAAIATGLSLPYFLLTWQPAWMRFLPKPGMWMVRFKQVLGFVMLALVVWLLDSFPTPGIIVLACSYLLVLAFACWLLGSYHDTRWALPFALLMAVAGWFVFVHGRMTAVPSAAVTETSADGLAWEPFSIARIRQALEKKHPVFVDFTAKWCLNCKVFEATVINTTPVIAAMKAKGVVTIKADYTQQPPAIEAALRKTGRAGVPVYVIFRKRGDYWIADGLTQSGLLEQINGL